MRKQDKLLISSIVAILALIIIGLFGGCSNNNLTYDESIKSGLFEYEQTVTDESIKEKYFYSDSYFKESGKETNEHLRTFAMALALAFNPTNRKETVNYNLNKLLEELSFENIKYYDLDDFSKDTIGIAIASKNLNNEYDLVVVTLRGASYGDEWESNFMLGESGHAEGFDSASLLVLQRLSNYLKDNKIDKYKLLVSGYSRAGAVSNLVGVHLNEDLKSYNMDDDDMYIYTFEAPKGVKEDNEYKNIHNVVNKNDLVTHFYPETWGLYRSGIEEDITTERSTIKEKYLNIMSKDKVLELGTVDKQDFIKDSVSLLPKNRKDYAEASDSLADVYKFFKYKSSNKIIEFFKKYSKDFGLTDAYSLINLINAKEDKARDIFNSLTEKYDNHYNEIKDVLTKEEYNNLKDDIFDLFMFFQPTIKSDYNNNYMFYHILTIANNLDDLFIEHYFSTNFNTVKSLDSYYN